MIFNFIDALRFVVQKQQHANFQPLKFVLHFCGIAEFYNDPTTY